MRNLGKEFKNLHGMKVQRHKNKEREREKKKREKEDESDQTDSKDPRINNKGHRMRKGRNWCHRQTEKGTEGMTKSFCL